MLNTSLAALGRALILGVAATLASSCASGPLNWKDERAPIGEYRTFQWVSQGEVGLLRLTNPQIDYMTGSVRVVNRPEVADRVRPAVEDSLRRAGYVSSDGESPDFFVTYYGKAENDDWVSTWEGRTPAVGNIPVVIFPNYSRSGGSSHREGIVYLTIYDAKTQRPAWSGSVSRSEFRNGLKGPELSAALDSLTTAMKNSA